MKENDLTSEKPSFADLEKSFDKLAEDYSVVTSNLGNRIYEALVKANLRDALANRRFENTLDSGGGIGKWVPFLSDFSKRITLLDASRKSLDQARTRLGTVLPNTCFEHGNLEKTKYESSSFDFVFAQGGILSYTPNPTALLAEFGRIIESGGLLWIDFYNSLGWAIESPNNKMKLEFAVVEDSLIFQMPKWDYPARMFHPKFVGRMLEEAGFRIEVEFGSGVLFNSIPFGQRSDPVYENELFNEFYSIEIPLSRDPTCRRCGKNYQYLATRT